MIQQIPAEPDPKYVCKDCRAVGTTVKFQHEYRENGQVKSYNTRCTACKVSGIVVFHYADEHVNG